MRHAAFEIFRVVTLSALYYGRKVAIAKICSERMRERTRSFVELQSHFLFDDKLGRPAKGINNGHSEGDFGYTRRFTYRDPRGSIGSVCRTTMRTH